MCFGLVIRGLWCWGTVLGCEICELDWEVEVCEVEEGLARGEGGVGR